MKRTKELEEQKWFTAKEVAHIVKFSNVTGFPVTESGWIRLIKREKSEGITDGLASSARVRPGSTGGGGLEYPWYMFPDQVMCALGDWAREDLRNRRTANDRKHYPDRFHADEILRMLLGPVVDQFRGDDGRYSSEIGILHPNLHEAIRTEMVRRTAG